jgi:hypothetical protein
MEKKKQIVYNIKFIIIFFFMLFIVRNLSAVSHYESFNINDLMFSVEKRGYDKIRFADFMVISERGKPELPFKLINLIIPSGMDVSNIIITVNQETLDGHYFINPSPGPIPIGEIVKPSNPDSIIYNSSDIFPKKCVEVLSHGYYDNY